MFITIITSVICSLISVISVHFLALNRLERNEAIKFKLAAYNDFINSSSKVIVARRLGNTQDDVEDLISLNDAKNRMLISAEPEIVDELIQFWEEGATLEEETSIISYTRLIRLIRKEITLKKHNHLDSKISNTIFKLTPSSYSFKTKD